MATALAGAGLVLAAVVSPALGTKPPPSTGKGGNIQLKTASDTNFCLDIDGSSGTPAAILSQCNASPTQRFTLSDGADGRNLVMDFQGRCQGRGTKIAKDFYAIAVAPCTYQAKERWSFSAIGELAQATGHRCAYFPRAAALVSVSLLPCDSSQNQLWKLSQ